MAKRPLLVTSSQGVGAPALKRTRTAHDGASNVLVGTSSQWPNDSYTVGWICAIPAEHVAAQAFLDERHGQPMTLPAEDNNNYTLGRIGRHNVVVTILPAGGYGTVSAAQVANNLRRTFPNIRFGLMVGVGGGAPSCRNDIRLGDVVVSEPRNGNAGVFQYDFGKAMQGQGFRNTAYLDQPPTLLRTTLNSLKATHELNGHELEHRIEDAHDRWPQLDQTYKRPNPASDVLYHCHVIHPPNDDADCDDICGRGTSRLISRPARSGGDDKIVIHYGLIASSNQVMKDAVRRQELAGRNNILCFEMEAAGLMNILPCLVVRGICDYSDSHKNKKWQHYAAMAAAAYAKDFLMHLQPTLMERPSQSIDSDSPIGKSSHSRDGTQAQQFLKTLRFEHMETRQKMIKRAHAKTCRWVLQAQQYLDWSLPGECMGKQFLWIKGKAGAGKSTLMNFLYRQSQSTWKEKTVIAFFFNARGSELEKSVTGMYRSLLYQLLAAIPQIWDGLSNPVMMASDDTWNVELLKSYLEEAILQLGQHQLICYVDALDECDEDEARGMISFLESLTDATSSSRIDFRVCFASRYYPHISVARELSLYLEEQDGHSHDITSYIDTELKIGSGSLAEQIRAEVRSKASGVFMWVVLVVGILNKAFDRGRIHELQKKLKDIPDDLHDLFRDILTRDENNRPDLILCIQWLLFARNPLTPRQLYAAVLSRTVRDLKLVGVTNSVVKNFIIDISKGLAEITRSDPPTVQFIHESVRDFLLKEVGSIEVWAQPTGNLVGRGHEILKQCCLDYLDVDLSAHLHVGNGSPAQNRAAAGDTHDLINDAFPFLGYAFDNVFHHAGAAQETGICQRVFLENFATAYRTRWLELHNLFETRRFFSLKDPNTLYILAVYRKKASSSSSAWNLVKHYTPSEFFDIQKKESYGIPLFAALAAGNQDVARAMLQSIYPLKSKAMPGRWNHQEGFSNIRSRVYEFKENRLLFDLVNANNPSVLRAYLRSRESALLFDIDIIHRSVTPLFVAIKKNNEAIVEILLEAGADPRKLIPNFNEQPIVLAAILDRPAIVCSIVRACAVQGSDSIYSRSLESFATDKGAKALVGQLLRTESVCSTRENADAYALLVLAVRRDLGPLVRLLLENNPGLVSKHRGSFSGGSRTRAAEIMKSAVQHGRAAGLRALLDHGLAMNNDPLLFMAIVNDHSEVASLLLERDADIGGRLLHGIIDDYAMRICSSYRPRLLKVARFLISEGADLEARDNHGRTFLHRTIHSYATATTPEVPGDLIEITHSLIDAGADLEAEDGLRRTPCHLMVDSCQMAPSSEVLQGLLKITRLLVHSGANLGARIDTGRTLLHRAVDNLAIISSPDIRHGLLELIRVLVSEGADLEAGDDDGRTPLDLAISHNEVEVIDLLTKDAAELLTPTVDGDTPMDHSVTNDE